MREKYSTGRLVVATASNRVQNRDLEDVDGGVTKMSIVEGDSTRALLPTTTAGVPISNKPMTV